MPLRVVASGNSFWIMVEAVRPHRLRNFAAHAQSLQTLIDTDFWNPISIVEDGHQFWRTYFRYHGDHQAIPLYVPVFQDAVLAEGYLRTLRAQFKQLRRWAYGSSDISYVFIENLRHREIRASEKWMQFWRLYETFFTWATAPLIVAFAGWVPLYINRSYASTSVLAHQLPVIAGHLQQVTSVGILVTMLISLLVLPPRPAHYRRRKSVMMVLQWALLPLIAIGIHSLAALNAMTRLMFGRYLAKFDVTEKAVVRPELGRQART